MFNGPGPGRPTKLTPQTQETLVKAIQGGASQKMACHFAGISPDSFQSWLAQGIEDTANGQEDTVFSVFSASILRAYATWGLSLLKPIREAIRDGQWFPAMKMLEKSYYAADYRDASFAGPSKAEAADEDRNQALLKSAQATREMLKRKYGTDSLERLNNVKPVN